MIIIKIINHLAYVLIRNTYWIYNLSRLKGLHSINVHLPVILEGKGRISIGLGTYLHKYTSLKIAKNAQLSMGKNATLERSVDIRIGGSGILLIGDNFGLGFSSRLFLSTIWQIGNDVKIGTNCAIFSRESGYQGKLKLGDGIHIGDNTIIDVCDDITIGNNVAIGPNCVIYTHDHDYKYHDKPAWKGDVIRRPITIEDGAWIGSGVTLLPGITIGERAVIAAGAVVTKDVGRETVVGGVPSKPLSKT